MGAPPSDRAARATHEDLFVEVLLDRSGSSESVRDATIDAFNGFIWDLAGETARSLVTLTQFHSESIDVVFEGIEARGVRRLTRATYSPRAMTPLYDAAGQMLDRTEQRLRALDWSGSVLCVVITDGLENASLEWNRARVFARIKELEARGWAFLYLGAHADAYAEADAIGIAKGNQARWDHSSRGAREVGAQMGRSAKAHRMKERGAADLITDEERGLLSRKGNGGYL